MLSTDASRKAGSDSARRILEILFTFTETSPRRTVKELSALLDIPVPSMHRYVALLRQVGLLVDASNGRYQLTPRVLLLGRAAGKANTLLEAARQHLITLASELDETVLLVQLIAGGPICVDRYESTRVLRLSFQPGQSLPPLRGASIKVLLGSLPGVEREAYIRRVGPTEHPSCSDAEWEQQLSLAGEHGWSTSMQETEEGVWAAAAAVVDKDRVVASVTVPCPAFRLTDSAKMDILEHVKKTASRISEDYQARQSGHFAP